jgi:major membrane immunogen (membrane-anchored lipoprotein)
MKRSIVLLALLTLGASISFAQTKDGTYSAKEAAADKHGYIAEIKIVVKGGAVTKIDYDESKGGKSSKWKDTVYNANMKKISGVAWVDAVKILEASLTKKGDAATVDAVTGATDLSDRFKAIAAQALAKK